MAAVQVLSMPPLGLAASFDYVIRECGCSEARATKLLAISKGDPLKAVIHHQKLLAVLGRQGHSRAQLQPSALEPNGKPLPSSTHYPTTPPATNGGLDNSNRETPASPAREKPATDQFDYPDSPQSSQAVIVAAPTIIGLAEPCANIQSTVLPERIGKEKLHEWDFELPRLPEEEAADIFMIARNNGVMPRPQGMAERETAQFNLRELCAAVQQGASLPAIQKYLQDFSDAVVRARINGTVEGIPSIFYAVEANDPALLRLWDSYGADATAIHPATRTPLLAYAIVLSEQLDGRDTSPLVATLLSLGAPPTSIPDEFYKQFNRDLSQDELLLGLDNPESDDSTTFKEEWNWCRAPAVRRRLARTAHLTQRYYLDRATRLTRSGVRHRQVAALRNAESILGIQYHLIGQTIAANHLLRKLMTYMTVPSKRPLVLAFAGPSGHGKTELARQLGDLLGLGLQVVDCTTFNEERELFGPRAPYVGSERGSPLNNFIAHSAGRQSVVFLDEFEKASKKIHQALLLPFDSGEYQDRRSLGTVDCSRTIWILATNALDETILQFCSAHPAILRPDAGGTGDGTTQHLARKLSRQLRAAFLDRFGAPITGRVSDFIPFLPFSRDEQAVVAHKFLLELAERVSAPVRLGLRPGGARGGEEEQQQQILGNVRLHVRRDASVCARLAEAEYSEELGARSLRKAVDDVQDRLVESYLDDLCEIAEGEGASKTNFVVDVRADEIVVSR